MQHALRLPLFDYIPLINNCVGRICGQPEEQGWGSRHHAGADRTKPLLHSLGCDFPKSSLLTTKIQRNLLPCSSYLPGCLGPQQIMWPSRSSLPSQHSPARCVCVPGLVLEELPGPSMHPLRVCAHQPNPEHGCEFSFLQRQAGHILWVGHWCTVISRESDIWEFTSEIPDLGWGVNLDGSLLQYIHGIL